MASRVCPICGITQTKNDAWVNNVPDQENYLYACGQCNFLFNWFKAVIP